MTEKKHSAECFEADDGSGDLTIELPGWVQNALGAKPGDTLIWTIDEEKGWVTLSKKKSRKKTPQGRD